MKGEQGPDKEVHSVYHAKVHDPLAIKMRIPIRIARVLAIF